MSRALPSLPAADAWSASWVEPLEVAWTLEVDRGTVDVTVPDGTIAELPPRRR